MTTLLLFSHYVERINLIHTKDTHYQVSKYRWMVGLVGSLDGWAYEVLLLVIGGNEARPQYLQ